MRFLRNKEENVSKKVWFFLAYTVCFAIIAGAVFSVFIINKKSFIWVPDGLQQHFNALLYYRSWLLSILDTLATEHKISVPLWDMQIGPWTETIFYTAWSNGVRFLFLGYYCGAASVFFKSDDLPAADSGRGG